MSDILLNAKLRNSGDERREVYRIVCECGKNYTAVTERSLRQRLKER